MINDYIIETRNKTNSKKEQRKKNRYNSKQKLNSKEN